MDNFRCELGHIGELSLLPGCPGVGHPGEGKGQGLVVSPDGELAALQMVSEVVYTGENAVQFPVKCTVGQLGLLQLRREET